jgi:superfamily II DNA or RNA helicase
MSDADICWDNLDFLANKLTIDSSNPLKPIKPKKKINGSMIVNITRSGTYIDTSKLESTLIKRIKNYYTLSDKTIMGYFKKTPNWSQQGNKLFIPRFGSLLLEKKFDNIIYVNNISFVNNDITTANNHLQDMTCNVKLDVNQQTIFDHLINDRLSPSMIESGRGGVIINLEAGMGKSFLAMYLLGHFKSRTLIVTHNSSILNQWVNILTEFFPNSKIGQYYGKKKVYGDIVVAVINSLVADEIKLPGMFDPQTFFKTFDMVILDECHEFCSDSRRLIYEIASAPIMIGLSATPDCRLDSLDKINHWGCGSIIVASEIKGFSTEYVDFKGKVTKICYADNNNYTQTILNEKLDLVSVPLMIGQLCASQFRLRMIITLILEQHNKGLNVLVFADRRSYLEEIRLALDVESQILTDDGELKEINKTMETIRLVGGSSSNEMILAKETKNIILTTYQYFGTGTSIPKMNCVILSTPRKSKSRQFIGRIFRLGSDYSIERQIIDIVDVKTTLKNQWQTRLEFYKEKKYEIVERKISWQEFDINTIKDNQI